MRLLPLHGRVLVLDGCPLRRPMVLAAWLWWTGCSLPLPCFPRTLVTRRRSFNLFQVLPYNIKTCCRWCHCVCPDPAYAGGPEYSQSKSIPYDHKWLGAWQRYPAGSSLGWCTPRHSRCPKLYLLPLPNMNPINLKASTLMGNSTSASSLLLVMTTITISCWRENDRP